MEAAPICSLVDAMFRLPAKLDKLLTSHSHTLPRGARDEIPLIKQDLEKMVVFLQGHEDSGAEDCDMMVKCLIKEVRELSYDMEDSVDQYEHAADSWRGILSPRHKKYKITRRKSKNTSRLHEKLKWRLWMANKIREFSVRSQEALQRYNLFNHPGGSGISSTTASTSTRRAPFFGSWHPTPYGEPVGINAPLKKLEAWLEKDREQKLNVVSVVGPGGIGKTMLAKELYRRIGGQFECRAFVRTSQKPDVRRLLISLVLQVRPHQPPHTWKVHNLIADIRTHLKDKRYLIVIDDVWATQTWDIVSRALPDNSLRSGMLITTGIEDVALKCCGYQSKYVLAMKRLGGDASSKLFLNTAFGPQHECPIELSEVSNNIIKKCAGLPLATVIVGSLVSRMFKPEQWDYVNKSLGYGLRTDPTSAGMKQVLNLSYNNLPQHLKACMMYLSIYQEDYIIQKDDLVQQWIAEGLICATGDKDKEEISRSYFDELISSRMIQPVHINCNDDVMSCTVHRMVLDFITLKSIEENFVTAIDDCQTAARFSDKVRRLSLHFGNAEAATPTNMSLSQLRTLAFFGAFRCLPSIVKFGLLRVLILHLWGDDESIIFDLTRISELFRLRYLHIICNVTLEVQQTQIQGLHYLETLKIDARMSVFPSEFFHLPGLLHLSLPVRTDLPNGIGNMASLCTLESFDLSANSVENVRSLGELTNLRDLRLTCSTVASYHLKRKMDSMGSIFVNLSNLRCLTLKPSSSVDEIGPSITSIFCDEWSSLLDAWAPVSLQRFEWLPHICTFSSLPKWIGHLYNLCILKIGVMKLAISDVFVLRGLPALTVLSLYVRTKPAERIIFNKTGFSVLKYFKFTCSVPWLVFEVDAMPNLRKLKLGFDAHGADQHGTVPVGLEHLSGLKEISAKIGGAGADDYDRMAADLGSRYAILMYPACPTINIQCVDRMFTGKDDSNSWVQEEEHTILQNQIEIREEDSVEQHEVLQKDSMEGANRNVHVSSATLMQLPPPLLMFPPSPLSPKAIPPYPALNAGDMMKLGITAEQAAGCSIDATVAGLQMSSPPNSGAIKRRKNQERKVVCIPASTMPGSIPIPSDLCAWRKYGQKPIKGSPYPRGYYKCCTKGCPARKQVERSQTDPSMLVVTYISEHNHPWPTQRNALANSTRSQHGSSGGSGSNSSHNDKNPRPNDVNEERKDHQNATTTTTTTSTVTTTASTSPMIVKEETLTLGGSSDQALAGDQRSMKTAAGQADHAGVLGLIRRLRQGGV